MEHTDFQLVLIDPNAELCKEFRSHFRRHRNVSVVCDVFQSLPQLDCIVSPANSSGLMDGGIDLTITQFFGQQLMDRVQKHIIENYRGEQPIGTSFIIPTGSEKHPFLAHAPTMRVPMRITATDNVYSAMWAMLLSVAQHNHTSEQKIKIVACPGLGTATGGVPFRSAARQMAVAYRYFHSPPDKLNWTYATERQQAVGLGGDDGFRKLRSES